jgi:uncharacterized protein DUF6817
VSERAEEIRSLLRRREAGRIDHPGGTLADHLERVYARLGRLGAREELRLAGLGHAVYGTDGFDLQLVTIAHREAMVAMLGPVTETIIYRYGACDRKKTWRDLATAREVWDRFDGTVEQLGADDLRDFTDLTVVNEVDVFEQTGEHAEYFTALFDAWTPIASPAVIEDARAALARDRISG